MATLPELLKMLVENNGSDLHIATQTPPQIRVHGHLQRLQLPELTPAETKNLVYSVLTDSQKKRFEESLELDFSFGIMGLARFRCNVFNQRGAVGAVERGVVLDGHVGTKVPLATAGTQRFSSHRPRLLLTSEPKRCFHPVR